MSVEWELSGDIRGKSPTRCDRRVAEAASEAWGVLSLEELRACGLTDDQIRWRARRGLLYKLHQGVYAVGHPNVPLEGRFLAAVKALGPAAVLSHFSAAALWKIVKWDDRPIEVTVTADRRAGGEEVRVHRSPFARHEWRIRDGIPITTPERTLTDLASVLPYELLRRATREAFARRLVSLRSLTRAIETRGTFRGKRNLLRILADAQPTRTELEDVVLDLILDAGFEPPDVNAPLDVDGRRLVPDFRWPTQRLIVEADGRQWHDHPIARADDAERQKVLEAHGERVVRVTWRQAISRRAATAERLAAAGAPLATLRRRWPRSRPISSRTALTSRSTGRSSRSSSSST
jgi:hypothetical protein